MEAWHLKLRHPYEFASSLLEALVKVPAFRIVKSEYSPVLGKHSGRA